MRSGIRIPPCYLSKTEYDQIRELARVYPTKTAAAGVLNISTNTLRGLLQGGGVRLAVFNRVRLKLAEIRQTG